jgi:carboxymethylenebutenolidase
MKLETRGQKFDIKTKDGICDSFFAEPTTAGKYPAVLFLMDGFGLRPYLNEMALKLAAEGFIVLQPNLLYRSSRSPVIKKSFPLTTDDMPEARAQLMSLIKVYDPEKGVEDVGQFLDFLSQQKNFNGKIGLTGYCMGGSLALRSAARYADKISAAASFHGGNLATEAANSPHLLLPQIKAKIYVAHADNDGSMPPEQIERFQKAVSDSKVQAKVELYKNALHGFTMADLPAGNAESISRHWTELLNLFSSLK